MYVCMYVGNAKSLRGYFSKKLEFPMIKFFDFKFFGIWNFEIKIFEINLFRMNLFGIQNFEIRNMRDKKIRLNFEIKKKVKFFGIKDLKLIY